MTLKVIFLITKDDVGGAQKYVKDLVEHLDSKRFEATILTGGNKGAKLLNNFFRPYFLFLNDIGALIELFFTFRRERPDIVHLNSSKAGVIGALAAKLAGAPRVIFTAHGWVFNPDNGLSFPRRKFYILMHKIAAIFQDKIINVSAYDENLAISHNIASRNKLITVYNGIDCRNSNFLDRTIARKALSKLVSLSVHQLSDTSTWVGSVGRLVAEKDYQTLIEAATLVKDAIFFIIGSGVESKKLKNKIRKKKLESRFFIIEGVAPAVPYLKAFNLFVLSSIKEGLPYTMLEAMAAKLPVIVTRVGGMTEIIDGQGLVMPPREPTELARAINYFLQHPEEAEKAAQRAYEFCKDNLSLERMVLETENVYLQNKK